LLKKCLRFVYRMFATAFIGPSSPVHSICFHSVHFSPSTSVNLEPPEHQVPGTYSVSSKVFSSLLIGLSFCVRGQLCRQSLLRCS
jgi:hypothetical protein